MQVQIYSYLKFILYLYLHVAFSSIIHLSFVLNVQECVYSVYYIFPLLRTLTFAITLALHTTPELLSLNLPMALLRIRQYVHYILLLDRKVEIMDS